jgi:hypothetical protein
MHTQLTFSFPVAVPAHLGPRSLIQFRNRFSQRVGLLGRVISQSQRRYLNTRQHKHRINTHRHRCLEWDSSPVHALDRTATVTGYATDLLTTKLLLVLASRVFFGFESNGTHDHILLSQIRESPNLERQVPVFRYPPGTGWPGTGFPFRRLLRLAGILWRYSTPPPLPDAYMYQLSTVLYVRTVDSISKGM